jgi:uroporphyrinogen-III synthase
MKSVLVLRPEPGNSVTARRVRQMGLEAVQIPLFEIEPVPWAAPAAAPFDALLLTSANAVRFGGEALTRLTGLDVLAVGPATAAAARDSGFRVVMTGENGVDALLDALPGERRLLHLCGADHHRAASRHHVEPLVAYRARPLTPAVPAGAFVALVHSPRGGERLAALAPCRARLAIAAISATAARACGHGWSALEWPERPDEAALLALAARLCQD